MKIISKELLIDVLGLTEPVHRIEISGNDLHYAHGSHGGDDNHWDKGYSIINLDTLTRLCKEYTATNGYYIFSGKSGTIMYPWDACVEYYRDFMKFRKKFCGDSELAIVIKATEWVRSQV